MKLLEKEKESQELTEAMEELQDMYNTLFYNEIKEKMTDILTEVQIAQTTLERATKRSADSVNSYLHLIKEDLETQVEEKQKETLSNISNWLHHLSQSVVVQSKKGSELLVEQHQHLLYKVESYNTALESSKNELVSKLNQFIHTTEQGRENVLKALIETKESLSSSLIDIKDNLRAIHEGIELNNQRSEAKLLAGMEIVKNQIEELKKASESRIKNMEEKSHANAKTTKMLLYGVLGSQVVLIGLGVVGYFI
ncbi:hypothetical protein AB685_08660 [Bacillus sp. LL01]|uniref:hypothetical protein n=1 Tax=Bacillus sp. LL01 TaxID=1665556 RepID=UPI00064D4F0F|nr:hypothetical protein [Bacillus sp. LL01]KMJ59122.1 hypothetical protein AB685_08660 [Bacillus sp. LL01]